MVAFAQNKLSPAGAADVANRRIRKIVLHDGVRGKIPNGTTDYIWQGWQTMEERNPFGGSGSTDTPTKQYIWGTYIDECVQLNLLVAAGPQSVPAGAYYLLQDLLYRAAALTNSGGQVVEAYDTDAYGNRLVFTGPGADGVWFTDDDVQSDYGANNTIFQGCQYGPETQLYYFRTRYYVPVLGRFVNRNPWSYIQGRYGLYDFEKCNPLMYVEPFSVAVPVADLLLLLARIFLLTAAVKTAPLAGKGLRRLIRRRDLAPTPDSCPASPRPPGANCAELLKTLGRDWISLTKSNKEVHELSEKLRGRDLNEWKNLKLLEDLIKAIREEKNAVKELADAIKAVQEGGCLPSEDV